MADSMVTQLAPPSNDLDVILNQIGVEKERIEMKKQQCLRLIKKYKYSSALQSIQKELKTKMWGQDTNKQGLSLCIF